MSERDDIIEKIRNLRAKASDAACTEAEAMGAAAAAAKLLARFDIEEEELAAKNPRSSAKQDGFSHGAVYPEVLLTAWRGIQLLTETKAYRSNARLCFIGSPQDVEMAVYLSEMIVGASKRAFTTWAAGKEMPYKQFVELRRSFMFGFGTRVSQRLFELYEERLATRQNANVGTALVVVKQDLIKSWCKENNMRFGRGKSNKAPKNNDAREAGSQAGSNVNLGRPLSPKGNTTSIGA